LQKPTPTKVVILVMVTAAILAQKSLAQRTGKAAPPQAIPTIEQSQGDSLTREALAAFVKRDWELAIRGYDKLAKLSPGIADYHLNLGIAYYSSGRAHQAVQPLRQALNLKPTLILARYYLGPSLAGSGQCKQALPYLKKDAPRVSEKHLKYEIGLAGIRCSFALNQPNDAVDFVRLLNREFPDDPEVLYQTVHVYSDLSSRASQELIFKAPSSFQVHQLNAEALETQGNWEDAAKEYRAILEKNPRLPGIHYRLGRLLLSAPKTETTLVDAKKEFEEELRIDPSNAAAQYVLGELAFQAADLNKAIGHFSSAVRLDVGFADAHLELGRALIAAERVPEAIGPLETAVRLQPENPLTHFHLSAAYSRLGRNEEAKRERALHKELSEKMRQTRQDVQKAVSGVPPEELAR
jgi:tetratricopeptide (TPR) repeat protein